MSIKLVYHLSLEPDGSDDTLSDQEREKILERLNEPCSAGEWFLK